MNDADLERRLRAMAPPPLPPAWESPILAAARPPRPIAAPAGWGTLAAAWLLIFALRLTTPVVAPPTGPAMSGREMAAHWREVRRYAAFSAESANSAPTRIRLEQEFTLPPRPRS